MVLSFNYRIKWMITKNVINLKIWRNIALTLQEKSYVLYIYNYFVIC